ncbi:MAG: undecaprenyl/decaprenyl-phosphate alpha-N-acetylglucosaminyl 1-phosphate transferase [Chloroflexi bacterium]|nr:undecaprenyl/decaprenyl-phosphate alpha-N-acetylglucosaminyl 1-phosphate transferase [Chloroflexota bacterium]
MLDVYLSTLGVAVGLGLAATLALLVASPAARLARAFPAARGVAEQPRWGGAVILFAFALTPYIVSAFSDRAADLFAPKSGEFLAFLGACFLIFAIGFLDDLRVLPWQPKLLAQIGAAVAVYAAGYRIDEVGLPWGPEIPLGYVAPVATVLWVVFFTNAINLIDGRDGVAAGVAVLAAATMAHVAASAGHPTVALLFVAVAGAGLGLLPFNLPPASAYLGDSGALLLGFLLGSLSIRAATGVTDVVFVAVPIVALGFPILDTLLAVVRRLLDHRHPLLGDQDHIHHRLEVAGFGPRGLLIIAYAISALFSLAAILLHRVHVFALEATVLLATLLLVAVILAKLGYVLSLWNSASMVWLRRRLRWVTEPATALDDQDG